MTNPSANGAAVLGASVTPAEVEDLFICLLRMPGLRQQAMGLLEYGHFNPAETHLALLWESLIALDQVYGTAGIPYRAITNDLLRRHREDPNSTSPMLLNRLAATPELNGQGQSGLVHHALVVATGISIEYGSQLLQRFLRERQVVKPLREAMRTLTHDQSIDNVGDMLQDLAKKSARIDSTHGGESSYVEFLPKGWAPKKALAIPTGVSFVDSLISNGQVAGETVIVLGQYGSGKTTLAVNLATSYAKLAYSSHLSGRPARLPYFFSYEDDSNQLRSRMFAHAAKVLRDEYLQAESLDDYSRRGYLKEYEIKLFQEYGVPGDPSTWPGELDRIEAAAPLMNNWLQCHHMTAGRGDGWIPEVVGILEQEAAQGRLPGMVIFDYVGLMAKRHAAVKSSRDYDKEVTRLVNGFCWEVSSRIGKAYNCTVWGLHQYDAQGNNKKNPLALLSHTEAALGKQIGENADFCLCMGAADLESSVICLRNTKARRGGTLGATSLMRLDGAFSTFYDANSDYAIDRDGNQIVGAAMLQQIYGDTPTHPSVHQPLRNEDPRNRGNGMRSTRTGNEWEAP